MNDREVREQAGWSQARAAVMAGVGVATLRLFEADRDAVGPAKRRPLVELYSTLRLCVGAQAAPRY